MQKNVSDLISSVFSFRRKRHAEVARSYSDLVKSVARGEVSEFTVDEIDQLLEANGKGEIEFTADIEAEKNRVADLLLVAGLDQHEAAARAARHGFDACEKEYIAALDALQLKYRTRLNQYRADEAAANAEVATRMQARQRLIRNSDAMKEAQAAGPAVQRGDVWALDQLRIKERKIRKYISVLEDGGVVEAGMPSDVGHLTLPDLRKNLEVVLHRIKVIENRFAADKATSDRVRDEALADVNAILAGG